ncbi:MAG: hypothetical protein FOGNACKC_00917 [Anaerolineae bacterium]|nr:hypothetical protein [Anaerolineae bacterium]
MAEKKNPMQECIHEVMHRFKIGKLMMGKSGQPVTTRNQAIAIALSMCGRKTAKKSADGCVPCAQRMQALLETELAILEAKIVLASVKANARMRGNE